MNRRLWLGDQGSAQLVRSIAGETLLSLVRFLQAVQKTVESQTQIFQFIPGRLRGQPFLRVIPMHRSGGLSCIEDRISRGHEVNMKWT
jgi:hypothetical protein